MQPHPTPTPIVSSLELSVLEPHPAFTDPRYDDWPLRSEQDLATMETAASMIRDRKLAAALVKRDREKRAAIDALHGREPFWVACPECGGRSPSCPCCHGRAWVSPLFASTWERRGI